MRHTEGAALNAGSRVATAEPTGSFGIGRGGLDGAAMLAWAVVGVPILWGVWITLSKSVLIFR